MILCNNINSNLVDGFPYICGFNTNRGSEKQILTFCLHHLKDYQDRNGKEFDSREGKMKRDLKFCSFGICFDKDKISQHCCFILGSFTLKLK